MPSPHAPVNRTTFGADEARRFYDWFGAWQDLQVYEKPALDDLVAHADFEHASAVFEFGCGTGRLAERLLENHLPEHATYTGVDVSTTMVGIAARRVARWSNRARIELADAGATLPYGNDVFDRFVSTYVFDLLPPARLEDAFTEARRVLSANGKLCIATSTEGTTPVTRIVSSIWKRMYALDPRLVGGCRPLRVSGLLDPDAWKSEHVRVVCSWGICSEVLIASSL